MMKMPVIKIIKVGTLTIEASEECSEDTVKLKHSLGIGGGSSVIYIEGEKKKILVDTGFEYESDRSEANVQINLKSLEVSLALKGIAPSDIDLLFITHWHRDHFGNASLFKNAEVMASRHVVEKFAPPGVTPVENNMEIDSNISTLYTPGHTEGHCSLIVKGEMNAAITGDAIVNLSYFNEGKVWDYNPDFFDHHAGIESMKLLAGSSDLIIPGHGTPFRSYKPVWMKG